jgi:hypothetical protein
VVDVEGGGEDVCDGGGRGGDNVENRCGLMLVTA